MIKSLSLGIEPPPHDFVEPTVGAGHGFCAAAGTHSPFDCFTGSKGSRSKYAFLYENTWASDCYIADADPSIIAVYLVWLEPDMHPHCYKLINQYVEQLLDAYHRDLQYDRQCLLRVLEVLPRQSLSSRTMETFRLSLLGIKITHEALKRLKFQVELRPSTIAFWELLKNDLELTPDVIVRAAASLVLRTVTFGSVVRENSQGELNVRPSDDKLNILGDRDFNFPPQPKATIHLFTDWRECMEAAGKSPNKKTILSDPPYAKPEEPGTARRGNGAMSPAYRGHEPSSDKTFAMATDCWAMALSWPQTERVFAANYLSDRLQDDLFRIAGDEHVHVVNFGKLDGMNKDQGTATNDEECVWIVDRRPNVMPYQPAPKPVLAGRGKRANELQLDLLTGANLSTVVETPVEVGAA